jgi:hypothetical protein
MHDCMHRLPWLFAAVLVGACAGSHDASDPDGGDDGGGDAAITDGGTPDGSVPDLDPPHLPYDAAGWTVFPADYTTTIYVDAVAGSDNNTGLSPDAPIKTLAQVTKLITARTAGESLRIELKRGGSWATQGLTFSQGGDAADHPLLIDGWSYGDPSAARPQLGPILMWKATAIGLSHIAFVGLQVGPGSGSGYGISYDPPAAGGTDLLIEDCVVDSFWQNINMEGASSAAPFTDFKLRRSQSINSYDAGYATSGQSKPQGIYMYALKDALLEENVFDHNAHHYDDLRDATEFGHDIYISNSSTGYSFDVTLRGNLVSRGLQSIKGPATGTFDGNVLWDDGIGGYLGSQGGAFVHNVVLHNPGKMVYQNAISANQKLPESGGFGIDGGMSAGSANTPITASDNLFAHGIGGAFSIAANMNAQLALTDNVFYDWQSCFGSYDAAALAITGNQCQAGSAFKDALELHVIDAAHTTASNNTYDGPNAAGTYFTVGSTGLTFAQWQAMYGDTGSTFAQVTYPDPTRDLVTYTQSLGAAAATIQDFVNGIEAQSRYHWQQAYRVPVAANWIRAGYAMAAQPVPYAQ